MSLYVTGFDINVVKSAKELNIFILFRACTNFVGRDSAVGIATRYGLDGPGIESRWG